MAARRSVVAVTLAGKLLTETMVSMTCLTISRLCALISVSANSQSTNSGTLSRSEISVLVKPIEPAPMTVTLNDIGSDPIRQVRRIYSHIGSVDEQMSDTESLCARG